MVDKCTFLICIKKPLNIRERLILLAFSTFFILYVMVNCFYSPYFGFSQELKITPKKCIPKKGFYIRLKEVVEDSRCPKDVTCIWAGQAVVIVEVFENKKLIEEKKYWQQFF